MKLYLAVEQLDSGGHNILAVKATLPDVIAWFDANADKQKYGAVCFVEPEREPRFHDLEPITVYVERRSGSLRTIVAGPMSVNEAKDFCRKEVLKFPFNIVNENSGYDWSFNTIGADRQKAWVKSDGDYTWYMLQPATCKLR